MKLYHQNIFRFIIGVEGEESYVILLQTFVLLYDLHVTTLLHVVACLFFLPFTFYVVCCVLYLGCKEQHNNVLTESFSLHDPGSASSRQTN